MTLSLERDSDRLTAQGMRWYRLPFSYVIGQFAARSANKFLIIELGLMWALYAFIRALPISSLPSRHDYEAHPGRRVGHWITSSLAFVLSFYAQYVLVHGIMKDTHVRLFSKQVPNLSRDYACSISSETACSRGIKYATTASTVERHGAEDLCSYDSGR
jgi:hypothetical protein